MRGMSASAMIQPSALRLCATPCARLAPCRARSPRHGHVAAFLLEHVGQRKIALLDDGHDVQPCRDEVARRMRAYRHAVGSRCKSLSPPKREPAPAARRMAVISRAGFQVGGRKASELSSAICERTPTPPNIAPLISIGTHDAQARRQILTMLFNEVDFLDRFAAAAQPGFEGVEYPVSRTNTTTGTCSRPPRRSTA